MNKKTTTKNFTIAGIIMTIAVTFALVWAGQQWKHRYNLSKPFTEKQQVANSVIAFKNLQLISAAQEKYKQKDWDNDGQKVYSRYHVHLWTTLDQKNDPLLIELIPKKLAFAIGPEKDADGYFYKNISRRYLDSKGNTRKNDYAKEWAIAAIDAHYSSTSMRVFLADSSGEILIKYTNEIPKIWPFDPLANGWETITSIEQIRPRR
jgi:hypothetical protein